MYAVCRRRVSLKPDRLGLANDEREKWNIVSGQPLEALRSPWEARPGGVPVAAGPRVELWGCNGCDLIIVRRAWIPCRLLRLVYSCVRCPLLLRMSWVRVWTLPQKMNTADWETFGQELLNELDHGAMALGGFHFSHGAVHTK